jgi:uracil phosphoribosyltransferase
VVATANTALAAVDRLKERGAKDIRLACLIRRGLERIRGLHPDVPVWTAAIDEGLDEHGFILPGLATPATALTEPDKELCLHVAKVLMT